MGLPLEEEVELSEIDVKISIWSMRPQPGTPTGEAWEHGCRQGWEWGCKKREQEIEALKVLLKEASYHIPTGVIECHGDKCREPHCASCGVMEDVQAAIEDNKAFRARVNEALK